MVKLQEIEAWNAALVRRRGLVAVFFGGTSGIGHNTVRALARTAGAQSLRDPAHYSYTQARSHICYMKTAYFEELARRHAGRLRLVHIFPGLVLGPGFENPEYPAWFRFLFLRVIVPLLGRWILVPRDENGARMLSLASPHYPPGPGGQDGQQASALGTNGQPGSGAYALSWNGEDRTNKKAYDGFDETSKTDMERKLRDHTDEVIKVIAAGDVFKN